MLDNKDNATSKHDTQIDPVTGILSSEIKETILEEKNDDVLRKHLSTPTAKKWTICRTTPFIFCYHTTEKGLKLQIEDGENIGNSWLLLKRHFAKW